MIECLFYDEDTKAGFVPLSTYRIRDYSSNDFYRSRLLNFDFPRKANSSLEDNDLEENEIYSLNSKIKRKSKL